MRDATGEQGAETPVGMHRHKHQLMRLIRVNEYFSMMMESTRPVAEYI